MRLEEHEHTTLRARSRQRRSYLGRMVRVVVEDFHAGDRSPMLESAPGAGELREYRGAPPARPPRELGCGNRAGGVLRFGATCEHHGPVARLEVFPPHAFRDVREP